MKNKRVKAYQRQAQEKVLHTPTESEQNSWENERPVRQ